MCNRGLSFHVQISSNILDFAQYLLYSEVCISKQAEKTGCKKPPTPPTKNSHFVWRSQGSGHHSDPQAVGQLTNKPPQSRTSLDRGLTVQSGTGGTRGGGGSVVVTFAWPPGGHGGFPGTLATHSGQQFLWLQCKYVCCPVLCLHLADFLQLLSCDSHAPTETKTSKGYCFVKELEDICGGRNSWNSSQIPPFFLSYSNIWWIITPELRKCQVPCISQLLRGQDNLLLPGLVYLPNISKDSQYIV